MHKETRYEKLLHDARSEQYNAFDEVDQKYLEELLGQTKGLEWNGVS